MEETAVRVENLEKHFGGKPAVKGVSFAINRGDIYGFVGKNGAGKTTVMRIVCGLMRPTGGHVQVAAGGAGANAGGACPAGIGYLPQNIRFDDNRSAADILAFFSRLKGRDVSQAKLFARRMGLGLDEKCRRLSPGQQRKLQLAVATIGMPALLVLDEPTAGLDPEGVQQVRETIRELNGMGSTVFISSHVLPELDNLCNRVAVIDEGKLLYQGVCANMYELDADGFAQSAAVDLDAEYQGRCTVSEGRVIARIGRPEVPGLLGFLHERGVRVYGVKLVGLEPFYNSLTKGGD
jgi:ABC-type multidrug transport system ATPase subunit